MHIQRRTRLWELAQQAAEDNPKFGKRKSGRKRKKGAKLEKGETYRITYTLIKEGKSIQEIAEQRKLAASTIEAHALKGIKDGVIEISNVLGKETIEEIAGMMKEAKVSSSELYKAHNGKYSYGILRMVYAHLAKKTM